MDEKIEVKAVEKTAPDEPSSVPNAQPTEQLAEKPVDKPKPILPQIKPEESKSFLLQFLKNPAAALQSGALGLTECLITLGVRTIGLVVLMVYFKSLYFDSEYSDYFGDIYNEYIGMSGDFTKSYTLLSGAAEMVISLTQNEYVAIIFGGLFMSLMLSIALYISSFLFGKIIFKGKTEPKKGLVNLFTGIESALLPFTVLFLIAVFVNMFSPVFAVILSLIGLIFSICVCFSAYMKIFNIDINKAVYTSVLSFSTLAIILTVF
ncbi:MAG: hypothetical protein LBL80_00460 [Ruminococcus sp.]|jgi:hypothetical protein|nr:hypothetical protein [Ruminococcus sp.]